MIGFIENHKGSNPLLSKKQPLNDIENICIFYKKQCLYNPQFEDGDPYVRHRDKRDRVIEVQNFKTRPTTTINNGKRYPKRVLDFKQERGFHPTQKPVKLMEYLIKTYTKKNDTILDFTVGSGTTLVACKNLNRNGIGIDDGFCEENRVINGVNINGMSWVAVSKLRIDNESKIKRIKA